MSTFIKGISGLAKEFAVGSADVKKMYLGSTKIYDKYGYDAQVEYLQSNGSQYINLGSIVSANSSNVIKWEGKAGFSQSNSQRRFVAALSNPNFLHYCEFNVNNVFGSFLGNAQASITSPKSTAGVMYDVSMTINGNSSIVSNIHINGSDFSYTTTSALGNDTSDFVLFRLNNSFIGTGQRIGENKLYQNNILKAELIPVRIGQVGYMYDKVSNQFFGNAGTGRFTLGPDV